MVVALLLTFSDHALLLLQDDTAFEKQGDCSSYTLKTRYFVFIFIHNHRSTIDDVSFLRCQDMKPSKISIYINEPTNMLVVFLTFMKFVKDWNLLETFSFLFLESLFSQTAFIFFSICSKCKGWFNWGQPFRWMAFISSLQDCTQSANKICSC
ncbi:uncharacterized protein [Rutidosis leptorrhynchoides]|uniref:uncharacterized protein isoform X4 n=1 Tax=Rutidosis leptorrhynchoides TaxID=125765 RepID=UPI003A9931F9